MKQRLRPHLGCRVHDFLYEITKEDVILASIAFEDGDDQDGVEKYFTCSEIISNKMRPRQKIMLIISL